MFPSEAFDVAERTETTSGIHALRPAGRRRTFGVRIGFLPMHRTRTRLTSGIHAFRPPSRHAVTFRLTILTICLTPSAQFFYSSKYIA